MSDNPSPFPDLTIDEITKYVGQWSGKPLGVKPREAKLVDIWHMRSGGNWVSWDAIPSIARPSQLLPGLSYILFISIEDTRPERYYRYADLRQEIYVDKTGNIKREGKPRLDTLTPKIGKLEYKDKEVKTLKEHVDEVIGIFVLLMNLTYKKAS